MIIMDPNTGEILAMANYPNFNLNNPEDLTGIVYSRRQIDADGRTKKRRKLEANTLWRNFCVSDAFEPGSTMKPFTVAAGLETGAIDRK